MGDGLPDAAERRRGTAVDRVRLRTIVQAANRAIERVNAEAPTGRQHRRPLDAAAEAERLERALAG
jgi:hypothetical protein